MAGSELLIAALAVSAAAGGASTYAGVKASKDQNRAASESMNIAARNASRQQTAVVAQQQVERDKRLREAEAIRGKLRVATAESGIGFGGTYDAFSRQLDTDLSRSLGILDQNVGYQLQSIRSGANADLAALGGSFSSPALEALVGGLRTVQTGMSIYSSIPGGGAAGASGGVPSNAVDTLPYSTGAFA